MLILTIILFFVILSILVLVHEFGHFIVSKRNGVKVEEFGLGFSPRICGWYKSSKTKKWRFFWLNNNKHRQDIDDTIYSLNFIPLGGFNKILGEDQTIKSKDSFSEQKPWVRFKIIIAGVTLNFLLAWLLLCVWLWAVPANIQNKIIVISTNPNSAAEVAGMKANDFIVSANGQKLSTSEDLSKFTAEHKGQDVTIGIDRYDKTIDLNVKLKNEDAPLGISLTDTGGEVPKYPWWQVPYEAFLEMIAVIWTSLLFLWDFIVSLFGGGKVQTEAVSGPVGIFTFLYQIVSFGWLYVVRFAALISLALAFFNILPFPALDGGRLVFIVGELIFKRKMVKDHVENALHMIGFIILLALIVLVTYNDISKLIK